MDTQGQVLHRREGCVATVQEGGENMILDDAGEVCCGQTL